MSSVSTLYIGNNLLPEDAPTANGKNNEAPTIMISDIINNDIKTDERNINFDNGSENMIKSEKIVINGCTKINLIVFEIEDIEIKDGELVISYGIIGLLFFANLIVLYLKFS